MDELDLIGDSEFFSAEFCLPGEQLAQVNANADDSVISRPGTQHLAGTAAEVKRVGLSALRNRKKVRFFNAADRTNLLEQEKVAQKGGRLAAQLCHFDRVIIDELGYLPFSKNGGQLLFHAMSKLYETILAIKAGA